MVSNKKLIKIENAGISLILFAICSIIVFPILWGVITSFRESLDLQLYPERYFPSGLDQFTFKHYYSIFSNTQYPVVRWFINSTVVSIINTALSLTIAAFAAYGFVFGNIKKANIYFSICIAAMTVPGIIIITPQYVSIIQMGLNKNLLGLILPGMISIYGMFLIRQFFMSIPKDFVESAKLEGAGHMRIFLKIIVPLGRNVLMLEGMLAFMGNWNDLQWAQLVVGKAPPELWTLTVGLAKITEGNMTYDRVGMQLACAVVTMVPVLIVYLLVQRHIIEGYSSSSGLKG
jgi:multiple sugar transport system permease protein